MEVTDDGGRWIHGLNPGVRVRPNEVELDDPTALRVRRSGMSTKRSLLQPARRVVSVMSLLGPDEGHPLGREVESRVPPLNVVGHAGIELAAILDEVERHPLESVRHGDPAEREVARRCLSWRLAIGERRDQSSEENGARDRPGSHSPFAKSVPGGRLAERERYSSLALVARERLVGRQGLPSPGRPKRRVQNALIRKRLGRPPRRSPSHPARRPRIDESGLTPVPQV